MRRYSRGEVGSTPDKFTSVVRGAGLEEAEGSDDISVAGPFDEEQEVKKRGFSAGVVSGYALHVYTVKQMKSSHARNLDRILTPGHQ